MMSDPQMHQEMMQGMGGRQGMERMRGTKGMVGGTSMRGAEMGGSETCPMCTAARAMMGSLGVVVGLVVVLLLLSIVATLLALTIFLVRRSRASGGAPA